ncbi:unnamed protein product [Calypogeia fissa]
MGENTDAKKLLLPYLQRADELQKHEPLVAYYCRLFAMERGLKIPGKERGKTVNALLVSLMNQLEKDKKTVKLGPDDNMYLEGFATRVFSKADKQDRAGRADLNTAKTFYAARLFFEVLHQFGEVPPDIEQRQKYAAWKAADIRKALSEGRKPVPGPPGGDEDLSEIEGMSWDTEGSPGKVMPATSIPSSPPDVSQPEEELPAPGVGHQQSSPDPLPRTSSVDSLPNPPTSAPASQGFHHTRHVSSDDIDLPSAPTQPVYPGVQHSSPPQYQHGFPDPYAPTHYSSPGTGQDTGAPPPVIHDWSGSRENAGQPYSSPFNYPTQPHDDYSSNPPSYSSVPPPSTTHSPFVNSTDQGYNYSQYPSAPGSGYEAGNTYPSVSPPQNYGAGYAEPPQPPHHQRTTSAPPASAPVSGYSNGMYPSDTNYQPPPDKIAEAHKAARFAVSSLAFDDVQTALEFLRKSLELLTVPSQAI